MVRRGRLEQAAGDGGASQVAGFGLMESEGLVLVSAMSLRNADAKRPGMHSNAKRWNEEVEGMAELETKSEIDMAMDV